MRTGRTCSGSGSRRMRPAPSSSGRSEWSARGGRPARSAATRSIRAATSARARTARTSTEAALTLDRGAFDTEATLAALRSGELDVVGRLVGSSNNAMVVRVRPPGTDPARDPIVGEDDTAMVELLPGELLAVWKPTAGEQPLFDFPIGTLTRREVAAFLVSETTGWSIVPPTIL